MIVERNVFQARYGRGSELVALLKEVGQHSVTARNVPSRILTDLTGPFFTVIVEHEAESLADFERARQEAFGHPAFGEFFARMVPLVESGSREYYTIEE